MPSPARPARRPAPRGPDAPPGLAVPSEATLLWGLLYDLVCAPVWLVLLLLGRTRPALLLRPLQRVARFGTAARMTALLIVLNLACFAWEAAFLARGASEGAFLHRFALVPADLRSGRWLPLLTHLFAHAGPAHLVGNMLTLFVFGRVVERHLGPLRTLAAYLGAAAISTTLSLAAQVATHQSVPTLGASGAVAGMVALGLLFEPFAVSFEALVPLPLLLLGWLAIAADLTGVLSGRHDGIDHFAHLGGYLSVLAVYALLDPPQRHRLRAGLLTNLATAAVGGTALLWLWLDFGRKLK